VASLFRRPRRRPSRRPRRLGAALALLGVLAVLVAGCAKFPESGPRDWREKITDGGQVEVPPGSPGEQGAPGGTPPPQQPPGEATGCVDPDPQVVATCLDPVGAIAVLPGGVAALVAERATGRILRVERGVAPVLVTTVPVQAAGGGGLTGLVLSPAFDEDQLVYAYASTPGDNRVLRIAPGESPKPVLAGIPRGGTNNGGALAVDREGALLVATGNAGTAAAPTSLAGKLLRIDTLGRPAQGNPDPASAVLSSGLNAPGGICNDPLSRTSWITDRLADRDVLYRAQPGPLGAPAWSWPARPGVAGCVAGPGLVAIAQAGAALLYVLRPAPSGGFTGEPELLLTGVYGRLSAASRGPDGLVWLGTVNKGGGGAVVPSDDRVIRIQPPAGGGSRL